ncbi:MAG TPA: PAS domain-containing protein, partial [Verrucomicrobiae bacterium]|nr:PAS domain-containing protein [Verrucomicrobiae bacterium]
MNTASPAVEAELRERERMLRNLTDNLPNGATFRFVWREDGVFKFHHISESIERLTGVHSTKIMEDPTAFFHLIVEKDRERMDATGQLAQKTMKQFDCQARIRTAQGEVKWLHWRSLPTPLPSGGVAWDGLVVDITPLKSAEAELWRLNDELEATITERTRELAESERRHRTLLTNLQGMVYRCRNDQRRTMEFMSEGCRLLLGVGAENFKNGQLTYEEVIHPDDRERVWNEIQEAIPKHVPFSLEYRVKHAGGRWRSVLEQGRAIFDENDHVVALEGFITDITDRVYAEQTRRSLEEQLRQAQKLEAIGTLAGGIAHDFNNILAAIMGSAELLKMDTAKEHPGYEFIQQILTAGNRAKGLVQQILTFSKKTDSSLDIVQLQPMVKECVRLIRATIPAMVDISSDVDPNCAPVLADPTQIHQVIVNLCTNAWHSLPERGGHIDVKLETVEVDEVTAAIHPDLCPGQHVRLCVRDNGAGMEQAVLKRIFEPFFTTKPSGKGTGLGLSVVHGIVKAHKGAIMVESTVGKGSAFFIFLPTAKFPEAQKPGETTIIFHGNGERVLLVDDEELPGRTVEKILTKLGYQVKRFLNPEQALTDFSTSPKKYDLVLSDLAMPGMSGQDLGAAMLKMHPHI